MLRVTWTARHGVSVHIIVTVIITFISLQVVEFVITAIHDRFIWIIQAVLIRVVTIIQELDLMLYILYSQAGPLRLVVYKYIFCTNEFDYLNMLAHTCGCVTCQNSIRSNSLTFVMYSSMTMTFDVVYFLGKPFISGAIVAES